MCAEVLRFQTPTPPFDRRRHRRSAVPHISTSLGASRIQILNMSRRGMSIETPYPFTIGGTYLFELSDQGRVLLVEGEVRWCRHTGSSTASHLQEAARYRSGVWFIGVRARDGQLEFTDISPLPELRPEAQEADDQLLADRIARLRAAGCPEEAAELLLDVLSPEFERLVLLRVLDERARAWMGRGPSLVPERLNRLEVDLARGSILRHLSDGGSFYFGRLPAMFPHLQLVHCWQGRLDQECALFPVRLGCRMVAILYADAGSETLSSSHLEKLRDSTARFVRTLERQILLRKGITPPASPDSSQS